MSKPTRGRRVRRSLAVEDILQETPLPPNSHTSHEPINELTTGLGALNVSQEPHAGSAGGGIPYQVPFCPSGKLATELLGTPRYLFRVYSDASAGENSSEWMKSDDAQKKKNCKDIFARDDPSIVALTLNEHLWWSRVRVYSDPFISWTTSLLVAIQYAIFKRKKEDAELNTIHLCIVDTTLFPSGVFIKDLDLIDEFYKYGGLDRIHKLRTKGRWPYTVAYYFGEYLSQGQTYIEGRSCTVPCDKIINNHLFAIMPQFEDEIKDKTSKTIEWANAVIEFREPFSIEQKPTDNQEPTANSKFFDAMAIASEFDTAWFLPMLANLLALSPRTARDLANIGRISKLFSSAC